MKPHTLLELHLLLNATACQLSGFCVYFSLVLFCLCWTHLRLSALSIPLWDETELHRNFFLSAPPAGNFKEIILDSLQTFLIQKENEIISAQNRVYFTEPCLYCSMAPLQQKSRRKMQEHSLTNASARVCTQNWDPRGVPGSVSLGVIMVKLWFL